MTGIPSDLGASAAQAGFHADDVAKARDANRAGRTSTARRQIKDIDEASAVVDTSEDNTQVFADSEGSGSSGRDLEGEETTEQEEETGRKGVVEDDQGQIHLDLEA